MTDKTFDEELSRKALSCNAWRWMPGITMEVKEQINFLENIIENALTYQGDDFYDNICQLNQDYKAYQKEFSEGKEQ